MIVKIKNKHLKELFASGKCRKLALAQQIVDKFFFVYHVIESAENIYDFRIYPSLQYKNLKGEKNKVSFRLNDAYRLIAEMNWTDEKMIVAEVTLTDINNHYE